MRRHAELAATAREEVTRSAVLAPQPAGPPGRWLLGHTPDFSRDQLGFVRRLARGYGDVVPLRFPPFRAVYLNRPHLIEEVLVARSRSFVKSLALRRAGVLVGNGLLVSEGQRWRRQRRLMQPAFHRQRVAGYGREMVDLTEGLLAGWRDGAVRDIQPEMMGLTLRVACKTLFGAEVAGDAAEVGAAFTTALECLQARISGLQLLLPDGVPTPTMLRLRRAVRRLDRLVYRLIAERRASCRDEGDLLSLLMQAQDAADGTGMTDRQLRDEVMTLVLGGHETTALALTWTWYRLAQHPTAEARLHAELAAVLGGRPPAAADATRLPFTNAVVAEALRLYPPVWALGREATEATTVGGYPLRKGTVVLLSPWAMHRDPRYFAEPDAFRPERWIDGLAQWLPRFAYFPFGGGPRQCIGNTFALLEATLVLATIAQRYRLVLEPGQHVVAAPVGTLRARPGVRMQLRARGAPSAA
jgi:cytochrome P450